MRPGTDDALIERAEMPLGADGNGAGGDARVEGHEQAAIGDRQGEQTDIGNPGCAYGSGSFRCNAALAMAHRASNFEGQPKKPPPGRRRQTSWRRASRANAPSRLMSSS